MLKAAENTKNQWVESLNKKLDAAYDWCGIELINTVRILLPQRSFGFPRQQKGAAELGQGHPSDQQPLDEYNDAILHILYILSNTFEFNAHYNFLFQNIEPEGRNDHSCVKYYHSNNKWISVKDRDYNDVDTNCNGICITFYSKCNCNII